MVSERWEHDEVAENDNFLVSWKQTVSNRIDSMRLKAEMPDVYQQFVKPCQSRRFMVKSMEKVA